MIFENLCDFIADIFQTDKDTLTKETSLYEDLSAEEEDFQELMLIFEEEFDISVTAEEIAELDTLGELSEFLEKKTFEA